MIKYIVLALIVIIVLSFFGYDLRAIIEAPVTQNNLGYAWGGVTYVWDNYLKNPVNYFWNNIFIGLLWQAFTNNLGRINAGAPTELENIGNRILNIGSEPYRPLDQ
ncbi:MAG: hypothetical protein HZA81_00130 [Candidatus Taylorbacteria bacterium]|nr:hypothetical protein [Candidatus Taylorbacteria bacterium]